MAYDANTSVYENIELFGLSERDAELPIPEDHILQNEIVRETFDNFFGGLIKTGLEAEIEPLAHGFATILQRRKVALTTELDRTSDKIKALVRCHDGSEINETSLEDAQAHFLKLREILAAIELMADTAAECYEEQTGDAFIPASGSRASARAKETGAVFEAKMLLEQHDRETRDRFKVEGVPLVVSGASDWGMNKKDNATAAAYAETVFATLDKVRERIRQTHNQEIYICHKGEKKGAEKLAAAWAKSRKVPQAIFTPRWTALKGAAPFRANDEMLDDKIGTVGVVLFGQGGGVTLNLGQKAEAKDIKVMRVAEPKLKSE